MVWTVLVVVHVTICLLLILAVLLQQGKGASMGILSGAGQTWFGPAGGKSLLMKVTVGLACTFLTLSVLLALITQRKDVLAVPGANSRAALTAPGEGIPEQQAPVEGLPMQELPASGQ